MECELCLNQWNNETRMPKILPCGHTICLKCLNDKVENGINKLENFKCPLCKIEIDMIKTKNDIINLPKNTQILSILDKVETQRSKNNVSNISMSMSIPVNTSYFDTTGMNLNNMNNNNNEDLSFNFNNFFYPLCQAHKNKATFYHLVNGRTEYICNECIQSSLIEDITPLPSLKAQNESKIGSCKVRTKLLKDEIDRIENFLIDYQNNFETQNRKKINELFDYINKIISYNFTTALTIFNQCKNEQKNNIDKKISELKNLRNELESFSKKLEDIEIINEKKQEPENQIELDNLFNKLGNYINYENELNLFQMNVDIKEEVKDSIFDLIQNAIQINVDLLKMKNGEIPTIKELLSKSRFWACTCGEYNNLIGKIICKRCSKYRPLETYTNIIFNPIFLTSNEKKEVNMRRKHEYKVYQSLLKRDNDNKKDLFFYAIDTTWFNKWKAFVSNDLSEKIMSNNNKNISENKMIGVLPPGMINNLKLCDIYRPHGKYRLKSGLTIQKDYLVINQYLWEWFRLNYLGGPDIIIEGYGLFSFEEDKNKNEKIIENCETIKVSNNKCEEENISNLGYSDFNPDKKEFNEETNKIHTINEYNFNTKFSEFRIHNIQGEQKINVNKNLIQSFFDDKENKANNIMEKNTQIKTLIKNINIEDNKF